MLINAEISVCCMNTFQGFIPRQQHLKTKSQNNEIGEALEFPS